MQETDCLLHMKEHLCSLDHDTTRATYTVQIFISTNYYPSTD